VSKLYENASCQLVTKNAIDGVLETLLLRLAGRLLNMIFFCVGVVYSGEYDACDVTLSVYPHRASLKNMPDHGGNRT
jgi:hypothetical protein